jgi:hypothetical protein
MVTNQSLVRLQVSSWVVLILVDLRVKIAPTVNNVIVFCSLKCVI